MRSRRLKMTTSETAYYFALVFGLAVVSGALLFLSVCFIVWEFQYGDEALRGLAVGAALVLLAFIIKSAWKVRGEWL